MITSFFGGAFFGGEFFNTSIEIIDTHDGFDTKTGEEWSKKRERLHDDLLHAYNMLSGEHIPEIPTVELIAKVEAFKTKTEIDVTPLLAWVAQLERVLKQIEDDDELMMVLSII